MNIILNLEEIFSSTKTHHIKQKIESILILKSADETFKGLFQYIQTPQFKNHAPDFKKEYEKIFRAKVFNFYIKINNFDQHQREIMDYIFPDLTASQQIKINEKMNIDSTKVETKKLPYNILLINKLKNKEYQQCHDILNSVDCIKNMKLNENFWNVIFDEKMNEEKFDLSSKFIEKLSHSSYLCRYNKSLAKDLNPDQFKKIFTQLNEKSQDNKFIKYASNAYDDVFRDFSNLRLRSNFFQMMEVFINQVSRGLNDEQLQNMVLNYDFLLRNKKIIDHLNIHIAVNEEKPMMSLINNFETVLMAECNKKRSSINEYADAILDIEVDRSELVKKINKILLNRELNLKIKEQPQKNIKSLKI